MSVTESTGWATARSAAVASAFNSGCIEIYVGVQPATPDLPAHGVLLGRITVNGGAWTPGMSANGLRFISAGRYAIKDPQQTWVLVGLGTGTARSFRLRANPPDTGGPSSTALRLDGAIGLVDDGGTVDAQMFLPSTAITPATSLEINNWWYAVPPIGD